MISHSIKVRLLHGITMLMACLLVSYTSTAKRPRHLVVYTHGDTQFARFKNDGMVVGKAPEILNCATRSLGIDYSFEFAPLSRARSLLETHENAVWFPSGPSKREADKKRLIGPMGEASFLWYQMKSSPFHIGTEDFRTKAKVTAYQGSRFEEILREEGHNFIPGSADHNRLIYMLMTGEVDAVLAIDFRFTLPEKTTRLMERRIRVTERSTLPIFFNLSLPMHEKDPGFTDALRVEMTRCRNVAAN